MDKGVCVSCGAADVELNEEKKCANCAEKPAEGGESAEGAAPAEGGESSEGSSEGGEENAS